MPPSDSNVEDVRNAILVSLERETLSGARWLPSKKAGQPRGLTDPLAAVFLFRTARMPGLMQQIVRLAHLMDHAGKPRVTGDVRRSSRMAPYLDFLHMELAQLTLGRFRAQIAAAQMKGHLGDGFTITPTEVRFLDPRLAGSDDGVGFSLGYNQMPDIAAGLDIVHNMLGYPVATALLAPVLQGGTGQATDVAHQLRQEVEAWLRLRLGSQHIERQTRVLRIWRGHAGITAARDITHASALRFWCDIGSRLGETPAAGPAADLLEGIEAITGFRMIGNACQAVLRYKDALKVAEAERSEARALSASTQGQEGDAPIPGEINLERAEANSFADWVSGPCPLAIILSAPASQIKWLTDKDVEFLWPAFGYENDDPAEEAGQRRGATLFATGRPQERFFQTLLLVQIFQPLQARLLKPKTALKEVMQAQLPGYSLLAAQYSQQIEKLDITTRAAAFMLLHHGEATGVELAAMVAPQIVRQMLPARAKEHDAETSTDETPLPEISQDEIALLRIEAAKGTSDLGKVLKGAGFDQVNRKGFSIMDPADLDQKQALIAGAEGLGPLIDALHRLQRWLDRNDTDGLFAADAAMAMPRLREMYGRSDGDQQVTPT